MRRPRIRRRKKQSEWQHRAVIELLDDSGETIIRFDLPMVIEEDDEGRYPLIQQHDRNFDPPLSPASAVSVTMRHKRLDG
jgi:hypothetical protein